MEEEQQQQQEEVVENKEQEQKPTYASRLLPDPRLNPIDDEYRTIGLRQNLICNIIASNVGREGPGHLIVPNAFFNKYFLTDIPTKATEEVKELAKAVPPTEQEKEINEGKSKGVILIQSTAKIDPVKEEEFLLDHKAWNSYHKMCRQVVLRDILKMKLPAEHPVIQDLMPIDGRKFYILPFSAFVERCADIPSPFGAGGFKVSNGCIQLSKEQIDTMLYMLPIIFWTIKRTDVETFMSTLPKFTPETASDYQDRVMEFVENTINQKVYHETVPDKSSWTKFYTFDERFISLAELSQASLEERERLKRLGGQIPKDLEYNMNELFSHWFMDRTVCVDYPTYLFLKKLEKMKVKAVNMKENINWQVKNMVTEFNVEKSRPDEKEPAVAYLKDFMQRKIKPTLRVMLEVRKRLTIYFDMVQRLVNVRAEMRDAIVNNYNILWKLGHEMTKKIGSPTSFTDLCTTVGEKTRERLKAFRSACLYTTFNEFILDNDLREYMGLPAITDEEVRKTLSDYILRVHENVFNPDFWKETINQVCVMNCDRLLLTDKDENLVDVGTMIKSAVILFERKEAEDKLKAETGEEPLPMDVERIMKTFEKLRLEIVEKHETVKEHNNETQVPAPVSNKDEGSSSTPVHDVTENIVTDSQAVECSS